MVGAVVEIKYNNTTIFIGMAMQFKLNASRKSKLISFAHEIRLKKA